MIAFIDDHRDAYGVEPICRVLPIARSTYHERVAQRQDPTRLLARARHDGALKPEIARVFAENFAVYGVRKVWRQMIRAGVPGARCTVARLIREMGLASVTRGKPVRATISDKAAPCPLDHVNRRFYAPAPNRLWSQTSPTSRPGRGSSTSPSSSIPMLGGSSAGGPAGRLMPASSSMHWNRRFTIVGRRIAAVSSIKYTERLAEAGIEPSVGSVGDSYDNALAETINGLYKAEGIHRCGPWRSFEAV